MKSGDLETIAADELWILDEGAPSAPVEPVPHDDEFRALQQKSERLNQYYDEVVAELRALLDASDDEGG
jgi:hypothetical protein